MKERDPEAKENLGVAHLSKACPLERSRICWQKMECLTAQVSCFLSSYGWDLGREGF